MSKINIVIVDDDLDILEFVGYNLSKEGFHVNKCPDAKSALDSCRMSPPDLLILDIMLPDMDGIELCYKMRNDLGLKEILIVFLSARAEDYSLIAGLNAGADDFIKKPIQPRVLISKVHSLLKRMKRDAPGVGELPSTLKGITIDKSKYVVYKDAEKFYFPKKERF